MNEIADIHNHILFDVDDGAGTIEESLDIIKLEYEQGVRNIILTPHFHLGECMPKKDKIMKNYHILSQKTKELYPDINLYIGNEIMACNDAVSMLDAGELLTMADSRYVLVEFFPSVKYEEMEKLLRDLLNNGYMPIIAHCERYKCLQKNIGVLNRERIGYFIEMGAYFQVNASSIFDRHKRFVEKMIDYDFLHLVATDAHNTESRGVYIEECMKHLRKKYSEKYLKWIFERNPRKIINNEYI